MLSNLDTAWRYPLALLFGLLTGLYIGGMLATIYVITAFRDEEEVGHRVQRSVLTLGGGQGGDTGKRVEAVRTTVLIEGREIPDAVLQPVLAMDGRLGEVLALHVEDDRGA